MLDIKTYENIRKIATGHGEEYTIGCLLDYPYFKENYKMIAIGLSKFLMLILEQFKIPSISGLATNSALTTVHNKILDVCSLVKKTDYDT